MLQFTERLQAEVRKLRTSTETMVISGGVKDMEHYKFLMGRIEGYKFVEEAIQRLLKQTTSED